MIHEIHADAHHTTDPFAVATEHMDNAVGVVGGAVVGGMKAVLAALSPAPVP